MDYSKQYEFKGSCPICEREMYDGASSINQHHFVPKSQGGKVQLFLHRVCHDAIHSLWTEKELAEEYSSAEKILMDARMQKFVKWVQKKDSLFYSSTFDSKKRSKKRKGR